MDSRDQGNGGQHQQGCCSLTARDLGDHYRASSYGEKKTIFNAFFAPGSEEDPRCRACDRSIHQHNSTATATTVQAPSSNTNSSNVHNNGEEGGTNPFEMAAIPMATAVGAAAGETYGWGSCSAGLMTEDECDDAAPMFRPYTEDDTFIRRQVPPHWQADSSRLWRRIGKGSDAYHACNIRGCPEDPTKITDIRVHMRSVHGIMTTEPESETAKRRPWNAPFCPTDDCGALCDCLWCCPCFLARITNLDSSCRGCMQMMWIERDDDEENKIQQKQGASSSQQQKQQQQQQEQGYRIQARYDGGHFSKAGEPQGCPCGPATWVCCWHFGGWALLSLGSYCTIPHPFYTMLGACRGREEFVRLERIEDGGCCAHCCAAHFCYPCLLVQIHRELRSIGRDPGTTCFSTRPEHIAPSDYQHDLRPSWQSIIDANRATIKME